MGKRKRKNPVFCFHCDKFIEVENEYKHWYDNKTDENKIHCKRVLHYEKTRLMGTSKNGKWQLIIHNGQMGGGLF